MKLDDTLCYCYRVSAGKVLRFVAREKPCVASLIAECLGAGTGCGWCVPYIERVWREASRGGAAPMAGLDAAAYEAMRRRYLADGRRAFAPGVQADPSGPGGAGAGGVEDGCFGPKPRAPDDPAGSAS